jgi:hypothetical protein
MVGLMNIRLILKQVQDDKVRENLVSLTFFP